jgi:hypothetical protein
MLTPVILLTFACRPSLGKGRVPRPPQGRPGLRGVYFGARCSISTPQSG